MPRSQRELAFNEYRAIVESSPMMIWRSGFDARCDYFNETWLAFTGRTLEHELGDGWTDGVHPDDLPRCLEIYVGHFERREPFEMEYRLRRHDGAYRYVFDRGVPFEDESGRFAGYIGSCVDVGDRKLAEQALRASEEKLRLAQDAAHMGSWDWSVLSDELVFSDRTKALFGFAPDAIVTYDRFLAAIHPEDRDRVDRAVKHALMSRTDYDVEMRVPRPDGTVRWVASKGHGFYDAGGCAMRMAGMVLDVTAAKRAEEALHEQLALQDQLAKLAVSVPGLICSFRLRPDGSACMPFATPVADEMYGISREVLAKDFAPAMANVHPDDARRVDEAIAASASTMSRFHGLFRYLHPTRGLRWHEVWSVPRAEPDGSILWHGFVTDVTERRRDAEALRASEETQRRFFENIQEYVVIYEAVRDEHGLVTDWIFHDMNARTREYLERTYRTIGCLGHDEPILGKRVRAIAGADRAAWAQEKFLTALAGEPVSWERRLGGRIYAVTAFKLSAETIANVVLDITDRKAMEDTLRESEAKLRTISETIPDPVFLKDRECRMLLANPATLRVIGKPAVQVLGQTDREFYDDPEVGAAIVATDRRIMESGVPQVVEERVQTPAGYRIFLSTKAPHRDADGRIIGLVGIAHDITDRKAAEEALRDSDRRKSEFLAMLSHELRNPLAPIVNSLYLLDRAPPGCEQATRAREVIHRQTQHLTRLVDDLLDVTRISRGKIELHRERVDLREVVRRTCDDHRSMFDEGDLDLSLVLPARPVWVDADPTRVSQIVGNLLLNAAKFTPAHGRIVVAVDADDAGRAAIRVHDTGVGMDQGLVDRVFEPFVQGQRDLARTQGGLGLGLALAKGLVELHGGSISASSEGLGRGSEFVVSLPPAPPPHPKQRDVRGAQRAAGRLVLIIEDNLDASQTLADVLELSGHHARVARDGRTGIALAHELKPDFVLCDLGLPDVDGYDVARILRADESLRDSHLIAISGYAQPEDQQRAREAGFEAHLPKPPSLEELNGLLAK